MEARSGNEPEAQQLPIETFADGRLWSGTKLVYDRALSGDRHVAVRTDEVDGQDRDTSSSTPIPYSG